MHRRKFTTAEGYRAIGMLESGQRQVDVPERLEVSQSVISRLFNRHTDVYGNIRRKNPKCTVKEDNAEK